MAKEAGSKFASSVGKSFSSFTKRLSVGWGRKKKESTEDLGIEVNLSDDGDAPIALHVRIPSQRITHTCIRMTNRRDSNALSHTQRFIFPN